MFVLTTYELALAVHRVRFFHDVNRAVGTIEEAVEVDDHSDGLRGYNDNDGDVRVERIKFEDDK